MPQGPIHAIVAVTYRCNARCTMCDIWRRGPGREMRPEDYSRLPSSLREINVTGGEPLLREDLAEIIRAMRARCPRARIVLSTNGLLPERLRDLLARVGGITVRVSLDGLGKLHDEIRGTKDAYARALEALAAARQAGTKDVGVCATITRHNVGTVKDIQALARNRGIQFTCTVVHSSPVFFGDKRSEEPSTASALSDMAVVRSRFFASGRPRDWFKGYFIEGMMDVLKGRPRPIRCRAGADFFYLDPEGNVYPCHLWDRPMGNILEKTYEALVRDSGDALASAARCSRRCWMTCTVAPEIRRHLPVYAARVGWAKARHHLRGLSKPR